MGRAKAQEAVDPRPSLGVLLDAERAELRVYLEQEAHYRSTLAIIQKAKSTFLLKALQDRGLELAGANDAFHIDEDTGIIRAATWPPAED